MKFVSSLVLGLLILGLASSVSVLGQDKDKKKEADKTTTLKGTITCTKCDLGETAECGHVIKVKDGDKTVLYYFIDKGGDEKYHAKVCTAPAKGSVTGVLSDKDKKHFVTPAKDGVKYD
jgi:hypothetical protein